MKREEKLRRMAKAYYKLLSMLKDELASDGDIKAGLTEGLTKFLSNLEIRLNRSKEGTNYVSAKAKAKLQDGDKTGLVFEHIVPKTKYIQEPCIQAAVNGQFAGGETFSEEAVLQLLDRYWQIALITKEEDDALTDLGLRNKMPGGWDGTDVFARYKAAGIVLEAAVQE